MRRLLDFFRRKPKTDPMNEVWFSEVGSGSRSYVTPRQRALYEQKWAEYEEAHPGINKMPRIPEKQETMEIDTGIVPEGWDDDEATPVQGSTP